MPELPEVETVVRDLRPLLVGRKILSVEVSRFALRRPWLSDWDSLLPGRRIEDVRRRGKWIHMTLDRDLHLLWHLGMTGQLTVAPAAAPVADHSHVIMQLSGGKKQLRFRDVRRFGSATLFLSRAALDEFFERTRLGPEPFGLPTAYLFGRLTATRRHLKAVLLDQRVVAGVGNIYADEALFAARLHPAQRSNEITRRQAARLRDAIEAVLRRGIACRGATIRDYVGGSGLRGGYQVEFAVYGRTGQPCRRCGTAIESMRLAGRSTHCCPKCQKQKKTKNKKTNLRRTQPFR